VSVPSKSGRHTAPARTGPGVVGNLAGERGVSNPMAASGERVGGCKTVVCCSRGVARVLLLLISQPASQPASPPASQPARQSPPAPNRFPWAAVRTGTDIPEHAWRLKRAAICGGRDSLGRHERMLGAPHAPCQAAGGRRQARPRRWVSVPASGLEGCCKRASGRLLATTRPPLPTQHRRGP